MFEHILTELGFDLTGGAYDKEPPEESQSYGAGRQCNYDQRFFQDNGGGERGFTQGVQCLLNDFRDY